MSIVREEIDADMGKVVFAPDRIDVRVDEPNTKPEQRLFDDIRLWVKKYKPFSQQSIDVLKAAAQDPRYSDFIGSPEDVYTVYRGMSLRREQLARWLQVDIEEITTVGQTGTDVVLKPQSNMLGTKPMSFSKDHTTARTFADSSVYTGEDEEVKSYPEYVRTVWSANVGGNNFFDLTRMQAKTKGINAPLGDEGEVVSFDPVKCDHVWWWSSDDD